MAVSYNRSKLFAFALHGNADSVRMFSAAVVALAINPATLAKVEKPKDAIDEICPEDAAGDLNVASLVGIGEAVVKDEQDGAIFAENATEKAKARHLQTVSDLVQAVHLADLRFGASQAWPGHAVAEFLDKVGVAVDAVSPPAEKAEGNKGPGRGRGRKNKNKSKTV